MDTGRLALGQRQFAAGGVVIEEFGIAAPLDGGFELATRLVFAEMLVEQILEEFGGKSAIGFGFESLFHLTEKWNIGESSFAKDGFAFLNVCLGEGQTFGSDKGVALFNFQQSEKRGGVDGGEKSVDLEAEFVGEDMQIGAPALIDKYFQQSGHATRAGMRKHEIAFLECLPCKAGRLGGRSSG